jgi:carboxyl-terminal processing protease
VWKTINEQYYDPKFNGVDWQAVHDRYLPKVEAAKTDVEFYRLFEEMLAVLRDAHTVFRHPQANSGNNINPPSSVGISLGEVEGKTVITTVEPDSDAARSGVKPGMILRSVNGKPVEELYDEIRSRFAGSSTERAMKGVMHGALLYGGFLGPTRNFGVEGFDSKRFDFPVTKFGARPSETPALSAHRLPSGVAYIKFDGWKPPVDERFKTELIKLMDAPALIIDLRCNGGGQTDVQQNIGSLLFQNETSLGSFRRRGGQREPIITRKSDRVYKGRIVVLVDEISASASEVFAAAMQERGRARIIGGQTCGCVLNSWSKPLKGGSTLRWSARIYTSPQNHRLEGVGVKPDEIVPLTVSDLRQGRDAALEAAERFLSRRRNSGRD